MGERSQTSQKGTKSFPTPQGLEEPTVCYAIFPTAPHSPTVKQRFVCSLDHLIKKVAALCFPTQYYAVLLACWERNPTTTITAALQNAKKEGRKIYAKHVNEQKNIPVSKRLLYRDKRRHSRSRVGPQHHSIKCTSQVDTVRYHGINLEIEP